MPDFNRLTSVLRSFDEAKAREFYVDFLGFEVTFEHRFEPDLPLYMGLALGDIHIHLTEHHGDAAPGAHLRIEMKDLKGYNKTLLDKNYKHSRPGISDHMPWGSIEMSIGDPFGNRLTFYEDV